jgi:hypothetical protein
VRSTRCCSLFAAVVHCLQAVPQRYSGNVHDAAIAQALALYAAAAGGPAQQELQAQLVACCIAAWQDGRQQCSCISLTGRQCILAPHDASEVGVAEVVLFGGWQDGRQQCSCISLTGGQCMLAPHNAFEVGYAV